MLKKPQTNPKSRFQYSAALLFAGKCTESADATFQSVQFGGRTLHYTLLTPGLLTTKNMCLVGATLQSPIHFFYWKTELRRPLESHNLDIVSIMELPNPRQKKPQNKPKPEKVNSYHCPWEEQYQTGLLGRSFSQSSGLRSLQSRAKPGLFLFRELLGCR